jgi:hypothetical protein
VIRFDADTVTAKADLEDYNKLPNVVSALKTNAENKTKYDEEMKTYNTAITTECAKDKVGVRPT